MVSKFQAHSIATGLPPNYNGERVVFYDQICLTHLPIFLKFTSQALTQSQDRHTACEVARKDPAGGFPIWFQVTWTNVV